MSELKQEPRKGRTGQLKQEKMVGLYNSNGKPIRCKECDVHMNEDDERWNGIGTVYCRECVWSDYMTATSQASIAESKAKELIKEKRDTEDDWSEGDKIDAACTDFEETEASAHGYDREVESGCNEEEDSDSTQDETAHYRGF